VLKLYPLEFKLGDLNFQTYSYRNKNIPHWCFTQINQIKFNIPLMEWAHLPDTFERWLKGVLDVEHLSLYGSPMKGT
jgi:hypothetical protein